MAAAVTAADAAEVTLTASLDDRRAEVVLSGSGAWAGERAAALAHLDAAVSADRVSFRFARTPLRRV